MEIISDITKLIKESNLKDRFSFKDSDLKVFNFKEQFAFKEFYLDVIVEIKSELSKIQDFATMKTNLSNTETSISELTTANSIKTSYKSYLESQVKEIQSKINTTQDLSTKIKDQILLKIKTNLARYNGSIQLLDSQQMMINNIIKQSLESEKLSAKLEKEMEESQKKLEDQKSQLEYKQNQYKYEIDQKDRKMKQIEDKISEINKKQWHIEKKQDDIKKSSEENQKKINLCHQAIKQYENEIATYQDKVKSNDSKTKIWYGLLAASALVTAGVGTLLVAGVAGITGVASLVKISSYDDFKREANITIAEIKNKITSFQEDIVKEKQEIETNNQTIKEYQAQIKSFNPQIQQLAQEKRVCELNHQNVYDALTPIQSKIRETDSKISSAKYQIETQQRLRESCRRMVEDQEKQAKTNKRQSSLYIDGEKNISTIYSILLDVQKPLNELKQLLSAECTINFTDATTSNHLQIVKTNIATLFANQSQSIQRMDTKITDYQKKICGSFMKQIE